MPKTAPKPPNVSELLPKERVLLVEPDPRLRDARRFLLSLIGLPVDTIAGPPELSRLSEEIRYNLVVLSERETQTHASEIVEPLRARWPSARYLLLSETYGPQHDLVYDDVVDPYCNPTGIIRAARRLLDLVWFGRSLDEAKETSGLKDQLLQLDRLGIWHED